MLQRKQPKIKQANSVVWNYLHYQN